MGTAHERDVRQPRQAQVVEEPLLAG
jgi:hypothetical protein